MKIIKEGSSFYLVNRFGMRICDDIVDYYRYKVYDVYIFITLSDGTLIIYGEEGLCFPGCKIWESYNGYDDGYLNLNISYKENVYSVHYYDGYFNIIGNDDDSNGIDPYLRLCNGVFSEDSLNNYIIFHNDISFVDDMIFYNGVEYFEQGLLNAYYYINDDNYLCSFDNSIRILLDTRNCYSLSSYGYIFIKNGKDTIILYNDKIINMENCRYDYSCFIKDNKHYYYDIHMRLFLANDYPFEQNNVYKTLMDYTDNNFRYVVSKDSVLQFKFI